MSEIKVSDQRGRRLSGSRSVDFIKQKCGREVPYPPPWRQTIGRCSLLEAKCCKRVEGSCSTSTMAQNYWKVFTFGVELKQKSWKVLQKGCRGKQNVAKVLEGSAKVMEMRCQK